ncbi:zinc-dependent alcohol dehydrogenase family protein [Tundrisphaera lichenicola]|uniref:zinc-dependent alcohol dehydrogenase family protein n=1 Tax=Tundrisphaera lichenicola TaxID=2029860 RepID=UPI003EBB3517
MKAYRIHETNGPDSLKSEELPEPKPGHGQVAVRVRAVSLNYRDLMVIKGAYGRNQRLPLIPLSDGAGEVAAVGPGVTGLKVGDRVAGCFFSEWADGPMTEAATNSAMGGAVDGMLAEQVVLPEGGVVRVPEHLTFEEAACLPCAGLTAWHALMESRRVKAGETVLIQGTGGVSIFALQFARVAGARVIATSSSDAKLARVREMGASDGINYKTTPDWDVAVRNLTEGAGVDHIVEVGGAGTLARSFRAVKLGGHIPLIGVLTGGGEVDPRMLLFKNIRLQGIYVGSHAMFEAMNRAIALHKIRPVIDRVFPFEQAVEAYKHLESGAHFGKVVIGLG